jgi:Tfp pilus assembly protein FimT
MERTTSREATATQLISPAMISKRWQTIGARRRTAAGFTLIELCIVLVVLMLFVGLVVPNLAAVKRSRELAVVEASIARLPIQARNEALTAKTPVTIRVSGSSLIMERTPTTGEAQSVRQVDLIDGIQIEAAQLNGQTVSGDGWKWTVYPDGTSDSGGLQFIEGSLQKSLLMTDKSETRWLGEALPDTTQDRWQAGELQQRG